MTESMASMANHDERTCNANRRVADLLERAGRGDQRALEQAIAMVAELRDISWYHHQRAVSERAQAVEEYAASR